MSTLPAWTRIEMEEIPDFPRLNDYVDHFASHAPEAAAASDLNGQDLSFRSLRTRITALQSALTELGVTAGDRVATWSNPTSAAWISVLATVRAGAVWLGLNPRYTKSELDHILNDATPKLILAWKRIGDTNFADLFDELSIRARVKPHVVWLDDLPGQHDQDFGDRSDPSDPCVLVYTSGTTGRPKGALLKQSGLVTCSRVQAHHYGCVDSHVLNALPINHVGSICDIGTTTLVIGGHLIFMSQFDPIAWVSAIQSEGLTAVGGVPTMLQMMLAQPQFETVDKSTVNRVLWSGSPMPRATAELLASLDLPMHNFYGMTETTGSVTFTAPDADLDELVDTIGHPHDSYGVRIADPETGESCAIGEVGEIQVQSPGVMHSYLGQPEATAQAFTQDGWFKTGDMAKADQEGRLHLSGRVKEMYKSGGYNVYPAEIEAALESVEGIAEAVVVSKPHPMYYEVGHAFLRLNEGYEFDFEQLKGLLSKHLANYKIPKDFEVLATFPMLPIGKTDKMALRKRLENEDSQPEP